MNAEMPDAYVLLSQPSREPIALAGLQRRRYQAYWPCYPSRVRLARGRKTERWRGVLPGYVLIFVEEPDWGRILDTPGVRDVIRNADAAPIRVAPEDVAVIERIEQALRASPVAATRGIPFRVGQRVRLVNDMLRSWEGVILGIDKRRQITIEIVALLGRATKVIVPASELEAT